MASFVPKYVSDLLKLSRNLGIKSTDKPIEMNKELLFYDGGILAIPPIERLFFLLSGDQICLK